RLAAGVGLRRRVRGAHPARESTPVVGERRAPGRAGAARRTRPAPARPRPAWRSDRGDLPAALSRRARARRQAPDRAAIDAAELNVVFRHARYFYPYVRKFNLYVLTILEPVGK